MDQYQEILDQSHLLDQEKFVNFFDNFLKKTQITKTSFLLPRDGDLKNSPINNYLSRMGKGQASDGNCNTVLEFFFNRYKQIEKGLDNKLKFKLTDLSELIHKDIRVNEKARVKSFDDLWNIASADPGYFLKSRIKWEDYENDLKENLIKISGQNWDYFRNKTRFHRHINRMIMQDFDDIADKKTMKDVASLADEIDSTTNAINAKKLYKGTGERMMGKHAAKEYFRKLKKIKIFFTTSFLTPVYSQIAKTPFLQITVPVIYRIFYSGLKGTKFKIDDSNYLNKVPSVARDEFLKRFIHNLNLLSSNISGHKK